jgi:tRNA uridine 5-carboxymethylaminomethyl modification enzyme
VFQSPPERDFTLEELLRRPDVSYESLTSLPGAGPSVNDPEAGRQVEIQVKYQGYVDQQKSEIARFSKTEATRLPPDMDYNAVIGLSNEIREKLHRHRPETLGQLSRLSGMTPAAVSLMLVHLKKLQLAASLSAAPADIPASQTLSGRAH